MAGAELDPGRCLELIAAEFLATYAYLAHQQEERAAEEAPEAAESKPEDPEVDRVSESTAAEGTQEELASASRGEALVCPENGDLPSPVAVSYSRTWREVLERDGYQCRYPACSARAALQVHHIEYRSRTGSKRRAENNALENYLAHGARLPGRGDEQAGNSASEPRASRPAGRAASGRRRLFWAWV